MEAFNDALDALDRELATGGGNYEMGRRTMPATEALYGQMLAAQLAGVEASVARAIDGRREARGAEVGDAGRGDPRAGASPKEVSEAKLMANYLFKAAALEAGSRDRHIQ